MTSPHESTHDESRPDDRLEAYLDGLLDAAQAAAFAERLRVDPALRRQTELQTRIDGALAGMFHVETPSREAVAAALASALRAAERHESAGAVADAATNATTTLVRRPADESQRATRLKWAVGLAVAAALAWVLAGIPWGGAGRDGPMFAARPLVDIYKSAVASGFEPTYECREPERFAATFQERQGKPLRLLSMPSGATMLGLAYVSGLSRQTTAMLCRVDGEPVMVFVDRAESDQAIAADIGDAKLRVFRQERDGLVFYEVTPFAEPRVTDLIAPPSADGGEPATPAK